MQLSVERLHDRLRQPPLAPLYFLHGEEPLQLMECADAVRACARRDGIAERQVFDADTGIDWHAVEAEGNALSLFASRRLLEIRLGERKPDKHGAELLERLAAAPAGDDIYLVSAGKLDWNTRKTRWCKALEASAVCVNVRDLRGPALVDWLSRRARRFDKQLARDAAELIAERVEGNMLAAAQEVEKLCLVVDAATIGAEDVAGAVRDDSRFDVFMLVDAVVAGARARALRIVRSLREEGTEALLLGWALGRELRQLAAMSEACARGAPVDAVLEQYRVWDVRRAATKRALARFRTDDLLAMLAYANFIDTVIKGGHSGEPWDEIEILVVKASGSPACDGLLRRL